MANPYADAARTYLEGGWSPIRLPYERKDPPPTGFTGYLGKYADAKDVARWSRRRANVGLRLPETVIGVDVDHYGDKSGGDALRNAEDRLGPLPPTWRSTSRDADLMSGIRLFRVPAARQWADEVGPDVEIIHHGHRYVVAAPSLHPEGRVYLWFDPDGFPADDVPTADELPALPDAWVAELDRGPVGDRIAKVDLKEGDVGRWLQSLPGDEPCRAMLAALDQAGDAFAGGGSRHDIGRNHVMRLVRLGEQSHVGAPTTLDTLEAMWREAMPHRTPGEGEWERMVTGAVALALAAPTPDADKGCCGERSTAAEDFAEPLDVPTRRSDGEEWFLSAIMPTRAYGVLSGPIGAGKSSILGYVVAELTRNGYRVRYCVEDEPVDSARHRLKLLGADLDRVTFDEVPDLTADADIEAYARGCAAAGTDLVVLDLLHSANIGYEENRPEKVKAWTGKIVSRFCHTYGVGVLGTHHWNNNTKAGSAMARLSGAGAIAGKAEFLWSVAISNDKSEQVWSIHARRRVSMALNFEMKGTRHFLGFVDHPFKKSETLEQDVYTVEFGSDTSRTANDVAKDAAREYAQGTSSRERVDGDALLRFLGSPRRRPEVDEFLYWTTGERYSPQTVINRLRDVDSVQCTAEGEPLERGKFWLGPDGGRDYELLR